MNTNGNDNHYLKARRIVAEYIYVDERGEPVHKTIRYEPKDFRQMRWDKNAKKWQWGLDGVKRVLYKLDLLAENAVQGEICFICEGEKNVDRLVEQGLIATCNPGGAERWRPEYTNILKKFGYKLVVVPDHDETGKRHARMIAKSCYRKVKSVRVVELPDLAKKEDVSDWLDKGHMIDELLELVDGTQEWEPSEDDEQEEKSGVTEPITKQVIKLMESCIVELFHDEKREPYAVFQTEKGQEIVDIKSEQFEEWVLYRTWTMLEKSLSGEALRSVVRNFSSKAKFTGKEHKLHVRYAWHEGAIWIDKDGHKAIRVAPDGWNIIDKPPILFKSFDHQQPIPDPVRGGDPWKLLKLFNIRNEQKELLLICYMVVLMIPDRPIPILGVHGAKGSAKTTLLKMIKMLCDPSEPLVTDAIRDMNEFSLLASQNRIVFFDNLSSMPEWLSNLFCRAVTGDGMIKRELYKDEKLKIRIYKIVMGYTSIPQIFDKPDALDRLLSIEMEPIPDENRMLEEELWDEFEKMRPEILGGLLDTLVRTLQIAQDLKLTKYPRMADFARYGAAAAMALGRTKEDFLNAYYQNINFHNEAAIEASPVAQAIMVYINEKKHFEGKPTELYKELTEVAEFNNIKTKYSQWPKNANWLSRKLKEVKENLKAMGVIVEFDKISEQRIIRIYLKDQEDGLTRNENMIELNEASDDNKDDNTTNDVMLPFAQNEDYDESDDNDDISSNYIGDD